MLNKWTLTFYEFHFPILLSIAHMAFSFVTLSPFMLTKSAREQHYGTLSKQVRHVRCLSAPTAKHCGRTGPCTLGIVCLGTR